MATVLNSGRLTEVRDQDPLRNVALMALQGDSAWPADQMVEIIAYCWEQLCWRRNGSELTQILDGLRASLGEDA